ncbi:MAG: TRAP transporter large permease subunit, partial [Nitrospiraceae bacterium]
PPYEVGGMTWVERLLPFIIYVLPLTSIFLVVVGSIVGGVATPTESAALGALATLVSAAAYRRLTLQNFLISLRQTMRLTVMTLFIICGSITFSQILAFSEASAGLSSVIVRAELSPFLVLLGMLAVLMFLGCFMDQVSMMMITMPLYMPVVEQMGYHPVWFGVLTLMILEISLATPPFGLLLFVAKGAAPADTTVRQVIVSVLPFIVLALLVLALLVVVPQLTLVLPALIAR